MDKRTHVVVLKGTFQLQIMTICYMHDHQEKLKSEWVDTAGHCSKEMNIYHQPCNGAGWSGV
jgi:hypothetical protein